MDYFVLDALVEELKKIYMGCRMGNWFQTSDRSIGFSITAQKEGSNTRIPSFFIFDAKANGFFLTEKTDSGLRYTTLLSRSFKNKTLNSRITNIEMLELDRIIKISLTTLEWKYERNLIFEMNTRPPNLVLVNSENDAILECLTKIPVVSSGSSGRLPGLKYRTEKATSSKKTCWIDDVFDTGNMVKGINSEDDPFHYLMSNFYPMTPQLAKKILEYVGTDVPVELVKFMNGVRSKIISKQYEPAIIKLNNRTTMDVLGLFATAKALQLPSTTAMVQYWYDSKEKNELFQQLSSRLIRSIDSHLERISRNMEAVTSDRKQLKDENELRRNAELLVANFNRITTGMSSIDVLDYYISPPLMRTISLIPGVLPKMQIERIFKKASKIQRARPVIDKRITELRNRYNQILAFKSRLTASATSEDLMQLQSEMIEFGLISNPNPNSMSTAKFLKRPPFITYRLPDGMTAWVGRGAKDNDEMTFHRSSKTDFWFHTMSYHGAHVIVRNDKKLKTLPDHILRIAAQLAVHYSKARGENAVAVIYASCNQIRKAPGGKPGRVIVPRHGSIVVASPQAAFFDHIVKIADEMSFL